MEDPNRPSDRVLAEQLLLEGFSKVQVARLLVQRASYRCGHYALDDPYRSKSTDARA